jgi:5-methylcytosine-specific restriction endonuclease McrA
VWREHVDTTLPPNLPASPEVDHIIPRSVDRSLEYVYENLQLSHRACNRAKSDGRDTAKAARIKATQKKVETSREW